jgi:D-arabinose 1-dehydrogenase-like Zn-dependent alcohol dehydrogenase
MRAMVFHKASEPLRLEEIAQPEPGPGEVLIRVEACGVCRTDLHIFDGDLTEPKVPLILGHEIVGRIAALGPQAEGLETGQRVGVPGWARRAAPAAIAGRGRRTCAMRRSSPVTPATAALPRPVWQPRGMCFRWAAAIRLHWRRCCAPG